jgi:hypothetical protein
MADSEVTPPEDLGAEGLALWAAVHEMLKAENVVLDGHELEILAHACRTADRRAQLRQALAGIDLVTDAAAVRLLAEERMQRQALAKLLVTTLGLPTGLPAEDSSKGKTPRSRRALKAADARWSEGWAA